MGPLGYVGDQGEVSKRNLFETTFYEASVYLVEHNASLSCCRVGDMLILVGL
jgi:hypothetical protein